MSSTPQPSYLRCHVCGLAGETQPSAGKARAWGMAHGWVRHYKRNGIRFLCPDCRAKAAAKEPRPIGHYDGDGNEDAGRYLELGRDLWADLARHAERLNVAPHTLAEAILRKAVAAP